MAKQKAAGGDGVAAYQDMVKNMLENPESMEGLGKVGDALEQMMKMSPGELASQMEQVLKMMTDTDMIENIVNQKEEVLKGLEQSGAVPPDELARMKADPNYFELKMRESFEQMGSILNNPEQITKVAEVLQDATKLMTNPSAMQDMMKKMGEDWQDDEKIEEARLQFLSGEFGGIPGFKDAFNTPEMQKILNDPIKWKETVKEGYAGILGGGLLDGAKDEL